MAQNESTSTPMDDCEEILREVYPYLDASLSDSARAEIQHHLDECLDCLHVYDFHAELRISRACRRDSWPGSRTAWAWRRRARPHRRDGPTALRPRYDARHAPRG